MKLVELLVKELEEWPEDVTYFVQDSDGEVKAGSGSEPREPSSDGIWIRRIHLDYYFYLDLCTDWKTSIVTKDIYTKHKEETQMKQIIVNVGGISLEEKQLVNEALAKIQNVPMIKNVTTRMSWFYAPSSFDLHVAWNGIHTKETPTHTPQQVLEMAGMSPAADQHVFFADTLIITDSSGSIIYDSTLKEKKKGHVHAELMAQYAEDAKTSKTPWELWQVKCSVGFWYTLEENPSWCRTLTYRREPKTHTVNGVEIPVFEFTPKVGEEYYTPNVGLPELFENGYRTSEDCTFTQRMSERGLLYPYTEEGKQAAILHSKAMLDIA